jgi:phosphate transport system permease protein
MSEPNLNPFAGDTTSVRRQETAVRWFLRLSTVLIVMVTLAIVGHIFVKGAPITFRSEFPFVNVKFLTELPGTLHVIIDKKGHAIETDVNGADAIKKQLGDQFREEKTISYSEGVFSDPSSAQPCWWSSVSLWLCFWVWLARFT